MALPGLVFFLTVGAALATSLLYVMFRTGNRNHNYQGHSTNYRLYTEPPILPKSPDVSKQEKEPEKKKYFCYMCQKYFDNNMRKLECNHTFHEDCIKMWLHVQREEQIPKPCPECRFLKKST